MSKSYEFVRAEQRSAEWHALRATGLGASDMAAVANVSPYKTPYQLWAEKTGATPPQKVGEAARRGVILEDAVARYYEEETGRKLRKSNGVIRLKSDPRFMASLDRTIVGEPRGIVEVKTSASPRWSIYPVPPEVVVQVTMQMGIYGAQWCDVVALLGGLVFKIERVQFDPLLWEELLRSGKVFLQAVEDKTPPPLEALDAAAFALATPQKSEEFALATEDLERVYRQHREVSTEIHFLEEKMGALEIVLKEAIGERAGLTGNGWAVTWRQARATEVTDWKLAAQAAGVSSQVVATYTSTRAGSRRFVVRDGGAND